MALGPRLNWAAIWSSRPVSRAAAGERVAPDRALLAGRQPRHVQHDRRPVEVGQTLLSCDDHRAADLLGQPPRGASPGFAVEIVALDQ
ncbi:MAG: hypothetical protein IPO81_26235 [Kouleothrix sp.]|nr:hypothetical protein [Kouleothrix sp.]